MEYEIFEPTEDMDMAYMSAWRAMFSSGFDYDSAGEPEDIGTGVIGCTGFDMRQEAIPAA